MNLLNIPTIQEVVVDFLSKYGYSTFWQVREELPHGLQNEFLCMVPATESAINFARSFKWIVMVDPVTQLQQGPYRIDKIKIPKAKGGV